jgi:hypothetical protein
LTTASPKVTLLPWHSRKKATTIALDPEDDRLLSQAARERGISRSEFIRQHLVRFVCFLEHVLDGRERQQAADEHEPARVNLTAAARTSGPRP